MCFFHRFFPHFGAKLIRKDRIQLWFRPSRPPELIFSQVHEANNYQTSAKQPIQPNIQDSKPKNVLF